MTTQAARFVGSIPQHYDDGLGPRIFDAYARDLARRAGELRPGAVLELAAGTGIVTRHLRDSLPQDCELLASDLNEPMLDWARGKFGQEENVRFETVDATDLPYADESFDVVACQFGVMFFPDKARSYREVSRVLRRGGHYLFNVWDSWAANPFAELAHEAVAEHFPEDPPGFYHVPFSYHDVDEILDALRDAGFEQVSAERVRQESEITSAEAFSRGLVFGNPLFDEVQARGGDPEQVRATVQEAIEEQLGARMPLQAIVVTASC